VRELFKSLRGEVQVTFEEGNHAAWLYDVVKATGAACGGL
jgi:hypothetical protein